MPALNPGIDFYCSELGHELIWRSRWAGSRSRDPFSNALVLIELSKGRYTTDAHGNVTGVAALVRRSPGKRAD